MRLRNVYLLFRYIVLNGSNRCTNRQRTYKVDNLQLTNRNADRYDGTGNTKVRKLKQNIQRKSDTKKVIKLSRVEISMVLLSVNEDKCMQ